ncbi:MAG: NUDIX domain-containing protein [Brevinema sp.]
MIRPFEEKDITSFPNIKILANPELSKEYLLVERKPFISCFIVIDQKYTIFVEQFRPVINQITTEMPMGKIEETDLSPREATIRELAEEVSLFVDGNKAHLCVLDPKTKEFKDLEFSFYKFTEEKPIYVSPGFSNSKQHPFILELETPKDNFLDQIQGYELCSQESNLTVSFARISEELIDRLEGVTKFMLISYLFHKK